MDRFRNDPLRFKNNPNKNGINSFFFFFNVFTTYNSPSEILIYYKNLMNSLKYSSLYIRCKHYFLIKKNGNL